MREGTAFGGGGGSEPQAGGFPGGVRFFITFNPVTQQIVRIDPANVTSFIGSEHFVAFGLPLAV